jgi:hypothetical protein
MRRIEFWHAGNDWSIFGLFEVSTVGILRSSQHRIAIFGQISYHFQHFNP